jgi:hypothetical protein
MQAGGDLFEDVLRGSVLTWPVVDGSFATAGVLASVRGLRSYPLNLSG